MPTFENIKTRAFKSTVMPNEDMLFHTLYRQNSDIAEP